MIDHPDQHRRSDGDGSPVDLPLAQDGHNRRMEQIKPHGIRPGPGKGQPPPGRPRQNPQPQQNTRSIAHKPQRLPMLHRRERGRVIEKCHRDPPEPFVCQRQDPKAQNRPSPVLFPWDVRLQDHPQPEIRKEHHRPGAGQGSVQPGNITRPASDQDGKEQNQNPASAPGEPEPEPRRTGPETAAEQIPKMPPGCGQAYLPASKDHTCHLTDQIHRQQLPDLPPTILLIPQKQPRQKRKQGHMYQIYESILHPQSRICPDPGLDPVAVYHQI